MALDPIRLDDLSWSEMVVAARRRIAAASGGRWTHHAPVDPGITLVELYSWQLEQRLYWMDQESDSSVRGALRLLGEASNPTQVAATLIQFSAPKSAACCPAMTEITLSRSNPPVTFSTEHEILLLPFKKLNDHHDKLGLFIEGKERSTDLEGGKVLRLFPANGGPAEIKIVLWLRETLPLRITNKSFSLMFDLRDSAVIAPQWSPKAPGSVPSPAKLAWSYRGADGKQIPFADNEINDGTGGLRRSGLVTLPIKGDWQPESSDGAPSEYPYAIWITVERATFSAPPRLQRLIPNVVIASHKRPTTMHFLTRDWLPLPGNVISLSELPENSVVKDHPPIESTVKMEIRERDGTFHSWHPTSDLAFHGPKDRVFVVDRQRGELRFGDGLTGRLPVLAVTFRITGRSLSDLNSARVPHDIQANLQTLVGEEFVSESAFLDALKATIGTEGIDKFWSLILKHSTEQQLKLQYFVGGGSTGKLGANLQWERKDKRGNTIEAATNVVRTEGGDDAETAVAARGRVAASLKQCTRAITAQDYQEIALTTPGIAIKRAYAAIGFHPAHPRMPVAGAVTVFLVPDVPRPDVLSDDSEEAEGTLVESAFVAAPVPDPGALEAIRARLGKTRLVASEVFVSVPRYRRVDLTISIETNIPDRSRLSHRVKQRLTTFLDPLIGGDLGEGWPFGEPLRPSALLRQARLALGKDGNVTELTVTLLDGQPANSKQPNRNPCDQNNVMTCTAAISNLRLGKSEICHDIAIGLHELINLRKVSMKFHRIKDNPGGLR